MFLSREGNMAALFVSACLIFATFFFAGPTNASAQIDYTLEYIASNEGGYIELVSDTADAPTPYGNILFDAPFPATFADLTYFSTDFNVTDDNCGGGSPRFVIGLDEGGTTKYVSVYMGPPPNYNTCTPNTWVNTGDLLESGKTVDTGQLTGGTFYDDYDNALANYGTLPIVSLHISVDSSWNAVATGGDGEQTIWIDNTMINQEIETYDGAFLTLKKVITNDNGGVAEIADFTLTATGSEDTISGKDGEASVTSAIVTPGTYVLSESGPAGYTASWVCENGAAEINVPNNEIEILDGQTVICTVTNNDNPPTPQYTVTIKKYVDGAVATAGTFPMKSTWTAANLNGGAEDSGTYALNAGNGYTATTAAMDAGADYTTEETFDGNDVGETCADGKPYALVGYTTGVDEADAADESPTTTVPDFENIQEDKYVIVWNETCETGLTIIKEIVDGNGEVESDFTIEVRDDADAVVESDPGAASPGTTYALAAGDYTVVETNPGDYIVTYGDDCDANGNVTVVDGETAVCTVTNTYDDSPDTATVKLCKKDPTGAPLAGWELFLKGAEIENLSVDSPDVGGTDTVNTYSNGVTYVATATGTWENRRTEGLNIVDAEYSTTDNWATQMDGFTGFGTEILELFIDGSGQTWGAYDSSHTYSTTFVGDGTTVNFTINDTGRADNFGSLDVSIAAVYSGTTDETGCIEFADVPYGTYEVDETDQDGWSNVSGLGEVEVDEETEEFVVVNEEVNNPPIVTITNPADGATVSGTVDIRGTLVEDVDMGNWNVAICAAGDDCLVNANRILQNNVPNPAPLDNFTDQTILTWDTTNGDFPNGNYIIRFAARDAAGNRDLTDPDEGGDDSVHIIEVTVDNVPTGTLIVQKVVVGGEGVASEDFSIHVKDGSDEVTDSPQPGNAVGTQYELTPGDYVVSETDGPSDFVLTFSGACDENGNVTVVEGEQVTCTLTNTYTPPNVCDKDEIKELKKQIRQLEKQFDKDVRELKKNSSKWVKKGRWGGYWQYDHWNYYKKYIELLKEYKIELHILVDALEEAEANCRGYDKYKWGKWHWRYGIPFEDDHDFDRRIDEWYH